MTPVWTILIPTIGERRESLKRLLDRLLPQVEQACGAVTVEALWNNGERSIAEVRQDLVEHATSEFVSFVDDDDMVSDRYVELILPLLSLDIDYVGFQAEIMIDGAPVPVLISLQYEGWMDSPRVFYRDINHLNPIRRTIALLADFRRGSGYEDRVWAQQLRGRLSAEREAYIGTTMYVYTPTVDGFTFRQTPPRPGFDRLDVDSPYFSWVEPCMSQ